MWLVGTVPNPDEPSVFLASRRGLIVVHHHFNLLGLDTFRWPAALGNAAWNWDTNPGAMAHAWQGCIAAQRDLDVMWCVPPVPRTRRPSSAVLLP